MNFTQAAHNFISTLNEPRRRGVLSANTQRLYRIYTQRAAESLGGCDMVDIRNGRVKAFVQELRNEKLSPSTIQGCLVVLGLIVGSIKTDDGERVYPQEFDAEFIGAPIVRPTEQPCATREDVERGDVLVQFLAATGLRISEALSLGTPAAGEPNFYDATRGLVHIERGKTVSAKRDVFLTSDFNDWFKTQFPTMRCVHPTRAHSFRRFRITHLRKSGMNESVLRRQVGHSDPGITSRYDRSGVDEAFARAEVERVGLGFNLPQQTRECETQACLQEIA